MRRQLEKKYIYQLFLTYLWSGFFAWIVMGFFIYLNYSTLSSVPEIEFITNLIYIAVIFFSVFYIAITYAASYLAWKKYSYELQQESFNKSYGVISLHNTSIPYEKIQNVNIRQPLVSRIFGLSILEIQTAGNSGVARAEGVLPGISYDTAEQLRNKLIHLSKERQQPAPLQYTHASPPQAVHHPGGL